MAEHVTKDLELLRLVIVLDSLGRTVALMQISVPRTLVLMARHVMKDLELLRLVHDCAGFTWAHCSIDADFCTEDTCLNGGT